MFFQRVHVPGPSSFAYVLGDRGEGLVVDPPRDLDAILAIIRKHDLSLRYVLETHVHEDVVLGSAELARVTGAAIVNGAHARDRWGHGDIALKDGEEIELGGLRIRALHTPGHTPESLSYAVWLHEVPDLAWGVFTGDALFAGATGRTDLADPDHVGENAGILYDAVHRKIRTLGEQTLLFPAHGAGSDCGADIAERDQSTLGIELRANPVFLQSRAAFVQHKVLERLPHPPHFEHVRRLNQGGGTPLAHRPDAVRLLQPWAFAEEMEQGVVIDARSPLAYAGAHIPGSYSVWQEGLSTHASWVADPATPIFLVLGDMDDLPGAVLALQRAGLDLVGGVLAGGFEAWRDAGLPTDQVSVLSPRAVLHELQELAILDVRDVHEFEGEGHIPGAYNLHVGQVEDHVAELSRTLPKTTRVAVTCSVGHRASLAVSMLRRHGYTDVHNVLGGMHAWKELRLPTNRCKARAA